MFKSIVNFIFWLVIVVLVLFSLGIFLVTREYTFNRKINLPLPYQIGGQAPILLELVAKANITDLSIRSSVTAIIEKEELNSYIPDDPFSLLVNEVNSPNIVSLLGKLEFVSDSIEVTQFGNIIEIAADMTGEFYVRERREYKEDEEQPDAGDELNFNARLVAQFDKANIDQNWQLNINSKQVSFEVDDTTKANWKNRYGTGDYFANLVKDIIDERANILFNRLETDSSGVRTDITNLIQRDLQRFIPNELGYINVLAVAVDNCPSIDEDGNISFSVSGMADLNRKANEELILPDLEISPTPCS